MGIISKQLDIKLKPFTREELDLVLRKLKNRKKSAGLDEIPPEVWKTRKFDDILLRHCNAVYNQNPINRLMKGCILPFPKKGDLGLAKNYRGITFTSIAAKIYNALLRNLQATILFVDFNKAFDSIHRSKMEQIRLAYDLPKETVAATMMLYRNTKVKENCFKLTKERSKRYPVKTITDADNTDDIALLANASTEAETLLHSLERAAASIGFHINPHKTEYMCFNQTGNISTQNGSTLKLVDKITYRESSVSSTETDINT